MKSITKWLWPTAEQKKQKLMASIEKLSPEGSTGYKLDTKEYEELEKIYMQLIHKSYGYEFVSYTKINIETQKISENDAILEANSTKYYNLWWPKKLFFRVRQLTALHTLNPNQISMLCVIALAILCYVLASVPSIFGYVIYPIMLFLTAPLLRHVSLMKWYTLLDNDKANQIEILAPILLGISLTIIGVIAKLIGAISIPFIAPNMLIIASSCVIVITIAYMLYAAPRPQLNLLFFMAVSTILALALAIVAPIVAISNLTLITNATLLLGIASLCTGFYNLYSKDTNKFLTLLCGLAIIVATITLAAALLNASFLFLLSPHLTFEMIASSLAVVILASITLYGCADEAVRSGLYIEKSELASSECFGVNLNLERLSFWHMMGHVSSLTGKAAITLVKTCWGMLTGTFSTDNISRVINGTTAACASVFTAASSCIYKSESNLGATDPKPGAGNKGPK